MQEVRNLLFIILFATIFNKSTEIPELIHTPKNSLFLNLNHESSKQNQNDLKPYMAALKWKGIDILLCGATIISPQYLITTVPCLSRTSQYTSEILTGPLNDPSHQQVHNVIQFITHPTSKAKFSHHFHDIGLIQLENPIQPNIYQKPIPIFETNDEVFVDDEVEVVSLKKLQNSKGLPNYIYTSSSLRVIDSKACRRSFLKFYHNIKRTIINENIMFCGTKGENGESRGEKVCEEMDGSPAVIDGRLAGIISLATSCLVDQGAPQVYTRISPYYEWILSSTGNDGNYVRDHSLDGGMNQALDESFRELEEGKLQ